MARWERYHKGRDRTFLRPRGGERRMAGCSALSSGEERQQIGVRRIRDGRTFALFRWQIPASLYSHLEVQLECKDGQTVSASHWNVIDRDSAF